MNKIESTLSDLAPGDSRSGTFDWSKYEVQKISSTQDPLFELAYSKLWDEFGAKGEIEEKHVLSERLLWDPTQSKSNYSFKYEMIVATCDGQFAAARDHSIIINHGIKDRTPARVVVHLSHALIDPAHRGTGMAGWLRAWPVQTARECISKLPVEMPITLVAEMEPYLVKSESHTLPLHLQDTGARFKSYQRAGFKMIDPSDVPYSQPDFRAPSVIDTGGGPKPLPLRLVIRRIGKETETLVSGAEVRETVSALYNMYGNSFRPKDMVPLWEHLRNYYPSDLTKVKLIEPGIDPSRYHYT